MYLPPVVSNVPKTRPTSFFKRLAWMWVNEAVFTLQDVRLVAVLLIAGSVRTGGLVVMARLAGIRGRTGPKGLVPFLPCR